MRYQAKGRSVFKGVTKINAIFIFAGGFYSILGESWLDFFFVLLVLFVAGFRAGKMYVELGSDDISYFSGFALVRVEKKNIKNMMIRGNGIVGRELVITGVISVKLPSGKVVTRRAVVLPDILEIELADLLRDLEKWWFE